RLGDVWERLFAAERQRLVSLMIERVDLVEDVLKIKWHALGWQALIGEFAPATLGAELVEQEATA
ncbi:MAG: recombinase family protein, partial [Gammaproteobacteria bacterium]